MIGEQERNELLLSGGWVSLMCKGAEVTQRRVPATFVMDGDNLTLACDLNWNITDAIIADGAGIFIEETGGIRMETILFQGPVECRNGIFNVVANKKSSLGEEHVRDFDE